ncbi:nucleotidyltransferase domain-containing protein [bacterium]|nr:nucleotidyltransferase domain-containing protein [bacterium]
MNKDDHKVTTVDNLIMSHLAGSHAYGMSLPTSDVDVRGIFCAPQKYIRTPWHNWEQQKLNDTHEDGLVYELSRFMDLYLQGNPNILETLWVPESSIIQTSEAYEVLKHYREDLLSSKVAFTFTGYAFQQLKRIKGHNKWINNPQTVEPPQQHTFVKMVQNFDTEQKRLPRDFTLAQYRKGRLIPFGGDLFGLYLCGNGLGYETFSEDGTLNTLFDDESRAGWGSPDMVVKFNKEEYNTAKETHKNFWKWKKERNVKRSELEEKYGYDTKHASHLIRLLRMGEEVLTTGKVNVERADAQELLDIRHGKYTYDEILAMAEGKDDLIRGDLYKNTGLRKHPDVMLATKVLMEVQDLYWR